MIEADYKIRNTLEYSDVESEIMGIFSKYELNYVEALGIIETLKAQIYEAFLNEGEDDR